MPKTLRQPRALGSSGNQLASSLSRKTVVQRGAPQSSTAC
jgi:hypothetical protein